VSRLPDHRVREKKSPGQSRLILDPQGGCIRVRPHLAWVARRAVLVPGGGGSVKTIETIGRANVPGVRGWEWVVNNIGKFPRVALGLGCVAEPGAARLAA
jgi:hypothetical protein